jgi:hypothetical protein
MYSGLIDSDAVYTSTRLAKFWKEVPPLYSAWKIVWWIWKRRGMQKRRQQSRKLGRGKVVLLYAMYGAWCEGRHSSYSFLTSALKRGEWTSLATLYRRRRGEITPPVFPIQKAGQHVKEQSLASVDYRTLSWLKYCGSLGHSKKQTIM